MSATMRRPYTLSEARLTAISLPILGALKSRAERDAKRVLSDLLARRKRGESLTAEFISAAKVDSAAQFVIEEKIAMPDVVAVGRFYSSEFDRALEGLWDVLNAAAGTEART